MKIDSDDGVLRLTFDRPDALNALTTETADELADAIEGATPETKDVIVITGAGDAFSAGGDLSRWRRRPDRPRMPTRRSPRPSAASSRRCSSVRSRSSRRSTATPSARGSRSSRSRTSPTPPPTRRFVCVRRGRSDPRHRRDRHLPTSWASEPRRNSRSPASSSTPNARPISNWSTRRSPPRNSTIGSQRRSTASRTAHGHGGMMKQAMHENLGRSWDDALDYGNFAAGPGPHVRRSRGGRDRIPRGSGTEVRVIEPDSSSSQSFVS